MEKTYWNLLTLRGVNDIVQIDEQEKNLCQKKTVFKNTLLHEKGTQIGQNYEEEKNSDQKSHDIDPHRGRGDQG